MITGIIVFAHGSRIEPANEAVRNVAAELARAGEFRYVQAAFLELGHPDLTSAVDFERILETGAGDASGQGCIGSLMGRPSKPSVTRMLSRNPTPQRSPCARWRTTGSPKASSRWAASHSRRAGEG